MTIVLNEKNFEETIKEWVTLVDFWAEWCWPCQMMLPIIDELSIKMKDKAKITKVNVDENPKLTTTFWIRTIPIFLIFKDWKKVWDPIIWVKPLKDLEDEINKYIN